MKKVKYITEKQIKILEEEAKKIIKMNEKIIKISEIINTMIDNNSWLNYLGKDQQNKLTEEEKIRLYEAYNIIRYSTERTIKEYF